MTYRRLEMIVSDHLDLVATPSQFKADADKRQDVSIRTNWRQDDFQARPSALVMPLEHIPPEGAQHHLRQRVLEEWLCLTPGTFDEVASLVDTRLDRPAGFEHGDHRLHYCQLLWFRAQSAPKPLTVGLVGQHPHCLRDRERNAAVGHVLASRLQVCLEPAEIQDVVDDLECKPDGFEEKTDGFDLRVGPTTCDCADTRERCGGRGCLQ